MLKTLNQFYENTEYGIFYHFLLIFRYFFHTLEKTIENYHLKVVVIESIFDLKSFSI